MSASSASDGSACSVINDTAANDVSRLAPATSSRTEALGPVRERERIERAGAFVEQRHREARRAGLAAQIADVTAVEQHRDAGDGNARRDWR